MAFQKQVVKKLLKKGYVVGSGALFGADYAIYEGDPTEFHASHLVYAREGRGVLGFDEVLGIERVARSTRKKFLIPMRGAKGGVELVELEWGKERRSNG